jgi:hypothetical protein
VRTQHTGRAREETQFKVINDQLNQVLEDCKRLPMKMAFSMGVWRSPYEPVNESVNQSIRLRMQISARVSSATTATATLPRTAADTKSSVLRATASSTAKTKPKKHAAAATAATATDTKVPPVPTAAQASASTAALERNRIPTTPKDEPAVWRHFSQSKLFDKNLVKMILDML